MTTTERTCAACERRSVLQVLLVVGCFGCGAPPWEAVPEPIGEATR